MADPILEPSLKTRSNTTYFDIFAAKYEHLKISVVPKNSLSLFPFNCATFLIAEVAKDKDANHCY
jgi:hypothetical protein